MIRRCIICGAEFSTPPSNNRRTCSPACSSQWRSKQHMGVSNRWSEGVKAAARAAAAKTGNLKNGTAAAMNLPERISIHAPLAGCDDVYARYFRTNFDFQSTHPLRGATPGRSCSAGSSCISIHAPLAGCDYAKILWSVCNFAISIHAPLAGCDPHRVQRWQSGHKHFNPRTPCGVRPSFVRSMAPEVEFQSTHPLRGATLCPATGAGQGGTISIHAPLAGCDCGWWTGSTGPGNFNPRTPCGVRRGAVCVALHSRLISIHAPLAGCD